MAKLNDESEMMFGIHRGQRLGNIDIEYLNYIYENFNLNKYKGLTTYIKNRIKNGN